MKNRLKYRKAVFIVVYATMKRGIRYLILKRKLHWVGWEFPKGALQSRETEKMAVKRELKEETGLPPLKITKFNFHGRYDYPKILPDRPNYKGQTFSLYSVKVRIGRVILDRREHSSYKWVPYKIAIKMLKWKNQKDSLRIVNNFLRNDEIRQKENKV
ncbi:MAG: NUDIX domain-containing protein [Candidatus Pacearchaeota archaeon]